jgi:peptide/nickel transport system ATP-binding protein
MQKLTRETGASLIWITHDLSVVAVSLKKKAVMYAGRIVEQGSCANVLGAPAHPYTQGLLDSVPSRNTRGIRLRQIPGMTPSLIALPAGCAFRDRCPRASAACAQVPEMLPVGEVDGGRAVRCHHPLLPRTMEATPP